MPNDTVIALRQPEAISDPLTDVLRNGARQLLAKAIEAEVDVFLEQYAELQTPDGHQRIVRHGHRPERRIQTGIGAVPVHRANICDHGWG